MKAAKKDIGKGSVKRILILSRFKDHVRAVQFLVNANLKRKVTFRVAMATVRELLECGRTVP